jgi:hypothetical protein
MPSFVILATTDTALADSWEKQLPVGRVALKLSSNSFTGGTSFGLAAVVVLDAAAEKLLPGSFLRCPIIFVGEPKSIPFEQARLEGKARVFLSYEESHTRLREFLPLVEELAEKQSMVELLTEKTKRSDVNKPVRGIAVDPTELWDFFEGAVENIESRDRLIAEFRRATRHLLRASHAVFFLREIDTFRADRGTSYFLVNDPLVTLFENHPVVVDGSDWEGPYDPVSELAVRNRLALWGAKLLAPVHDNGKLLGLIALGVRNDGQAYDELDRNRLVFFARLFRHFLAKCAQHSRLHSISEQISLGAKYLPQTLVLGSDEPAPKNIPVIVRDLVGQVRKKREICRVASSDGQPFRASAGLVAETGGVWVYWEEASGEVHDATVRQKTSRRILLRELSLTLSHEMGNSLVSLTMFRQMGFDQPLPAALIETIKNDIGKLEGLNKNIELMQNLEETASESVDIRELAQSIGHSLGVRVEVGPDPVYLAIAFINCNDCRKPG